MRPGVAGAAGALRAVLVGAGAVLLRLAREGMVIRALAWPGLLAGVAAVGTVLVVTRGGTAPTEAPHLALAVTEAEALRAPLAAVGLSVRVDPDPASARAAGRASRAAWREGEGWVLAVPGGDPDSLRAEAVLRAEVGAAWQLDVPPEPPRRVAVEAQAGRMGQLVAVLYTLYGVVMGAGLAWRDRGEGVVEAALPLPVPAWTHGAARILALGAALGVGVLATLLLLHGIFGMDRPVARVAHGAVAAATGAAVGLAAVGGRAAARRGFSGPLSRAMAVVAALLGLGWAAPAVGAWLPLASLAAAPSGALPVLSATALGAVGLGLASAWWGRHHGGLGR